MINCEVCGKKQMWAGACLVGMMKAKKLEFRETDEKGGKYLFKEAVGF